MCDIPVYNCVSVLNRNSIYMRCCFGTGSEHAVLFHRKWLWSWNQQELDIHNYCMKVNCTRFYMVVLEFHISGRIFVIYLVAVASSVYFKYWLWGCYFLCMCTLRVFLIVEINEIILCDMVWVSVFCCLQNTVHYRLHNIGNGSAIFLDCIKILCFCNIVFYKCGLNEGKTVKLFLYLM
jgi:hypothetical protein